MTILEKTIATPSIAEDPRLHRFTRDEYYQMADLGFFQAKRVELIYGEIVEMAAMKDMHAAGILLAIDAFKAALPGLLVRSQLPLNLAEHSAPEPDISVVTGTIRDYVGTGHPKTAELIVEISDTTLNYDRSIKAALFAEAGIRDYWIVNLNSNCVEGMREPMQDISSPLGWRYGSVTVFKAGDKLSPLAKAGVGIAVADLLP